jgi:hypothetical protein
VKIRIFPLLVGDAAPIYEAYTLLEGRAGVTDQAVFIKVYPAKRLPDAWKRPFAYADNADIGRLDEGNIQPVSEPVRQYLGQIGSRYPSGGPSSNNNDLLLQDALRRLSLWLQAS